MERNPGYLGRRQKLKRSAHPDPGGRTGQREGLAQKNDKIKSFFFFFQLKFIYFDGGWGMVQREKERENSKQALCCQHGA